eukprot:CAMPEP_0119382204 /NCGR_PEP_ID=MMETSP1334-20130426/70519_1 /TAXON_ID=127549 /ORGANISM="Calcidiscus leptoporus, Strain RCC1130" /LENGTH=47 /DNA_ID= /DNA_START= /DNA_END= /DNA_ORIENTATION=
MNLLRKARELWADMELVQRPRDYWTYNEYLRALGKAGAVPEALDLFD